MRVRLGGDGAAAVDPDALGRRVTAEALRADLIGPFRFLPLVLEVADDAAAPDLEQDDAALA